MRIAMSKSAGAWIAIVLGSAFIVISVSSLLSKPDVTAVIFLVAGLFFLITGAAGYLRQGTARMRLAAPDVDVLGEPLRVGQEFSVTYRQMCKRAAAVGGIRFDLVRRETVKYTTSDSRGGTSTATATHDDAVQDITTAGCQFTAGETLNERCTLRIPVNGMHTFMADNNSIKWYVIVCVEIDRWPNYQWEREVFVSPQLLGAADG